MSPAPGESNGNSTTGLARAGPCDGPIHLFLRSPPRRKLPQHANYHKDNLEPPENIKPNETCDLTIGRQSAKQQVHPQRNLLPANIHIKKKYSEQIRKIRTAEGMQSGEGYLYCGGKRQAHIIACVNVRTPEMSP
jgi:hypothetical protein